MLHRLREFDLQAAGRERNIGIRGQVLRERDGTHAGRAAVDRRRVVQDRNERRDAHAEDRERTEGHGAHRH